MKISLKNRYLFVFLSLFLTVLCQSAYAVPMTTNYQGNLKDAAGNPLNGKFMVSFSLYNVSTGGTPIWTEKSGVTVKEGAFSVILGSSKSIPVNITGEKSLYLGIKVNADPEMKPRQMITSSFFAMRAGVAETVVKGAINSDSLTAGSVTMEKVADGAIGSSKLAASAVTDSNLAPNAVTGDKITNGTITNDKLSADVQQKLEQSGQMPSSVETLNVTYQLKVGTNSMYLGQNDAGAPNSIYTDDSALLMQSAGKNQNTLINANEDTGKVGVGTMYPSAKLDVKGPVKISPIAQAEFTDSFWLNFNTGLLMFYNDTLKTGEINSLDLGGTGGYSDLSLNGKNIFLNEKQSASLKVPAGNVGIGLLSGTTPKNKLDIAGSVAIGSTYAGVNSAPADGLIVQGNVGIGTTDPWAKLEIKTVTATGLQVSNECGDWCYNTLIRVTSDNTKAIAVQKGTAHQNGPTDAFVVNGRGDVYARSYNLQSDETLKEDIEPIKGSLEKVLKLRGVTFRFKNDSDKSGHKEMGVIAQEIEKVVPEVVNTSGETGLKSVSYQNIVALLIESTKEQQSQIEQLKAQNDALKAIVCKDHPQEAICK